MKYIVAITMLLTLTGCLHKHDLMKANAVSMRHYHLPAHAKLVKVADVSTKYCADVKFASGKDIGLMDEAIKKAEAEHSIDFIVNATFSTWGNCVIVEGEGVRIEQQS